LSKDGLKSKHHNGNPKNDKDRFEIVVGAILTQNTSWNNVEKALFNLNKEDLIDVKKMAAAKESRIAELIKPSGYYNQKAKRLKTIAMHLLRRPSLPEERKELLKVNGIGQETADSIILYAAEKPSFVVDAYTKRIFSRLGLVDENEKYEKVKELFEGKLKKDVETFKEYHALIVEHAKKHCNKKPKCDKCILAKKCRYHTLNTSRTSASSILK